MLIEINHLLRGIAVNISSWTGDKKTIILLLSFFVSINNKISITQVLIGYFKLCICFPTFLPKEKKSNWWTENEPCGLRTVKIKARDRTPLSFSSKSSTDRQPKSGSWDQTRLRKAISRLAKRRGFCPHRRPRSTCLAFLESQTPGRVYV